MTRTINNNPSSKPYCCHINCNKDATSEIIFSNQFEDYTHSCDIHLSELSGNNSISIKSIAPIAEVKHCVYCEQEIMDNYLSKSIDKLCAGCDCAYDNKTGHCSLSCCMGNGCDEVC